MRLKPHMFIELVEIIEKHRQTGKTLDAENQKQQFKIRKEISFN